MGAEGGVGGGGAGEDDDLEAAEGGEVEHALEGLDAGGIGVGEGVVEEDGEAAVVVGGEDFCHGEAGGGGDLFFGTATEGGEGEGGIARADEVEAGDAGVGKVDPDFGAGAEEALEVAGDAVGEGLDEAAVGGFAGAGEELVEFPDGEGAALFGGVEFVGGLATGEGVAELGGGVGGAVEGELGAGGDAAALGFALAVFLLAEGAAEAVEIGGEGLWCKLGEGLAGGGE